MQLKDIRNLSYIWVIEMKTLLLFVLLVVIVITSATMCNADILDNRWLEKYGKALQKDGYNLHPISGWDKLVGDTSFTRLDCLDNNGNHVIVEMTKINGEFITKMYPPQQREGRYKENKPAKKQKMVKHSNDPASAAESKRALTDLAVIPLQQGVNTVERFSSDGRQAIIAKGWRDNGNAHGYNFFLVLMPTAVGRADWNVVDKVVPDKWHSSDFIRDDPHMDEDFISSVRFARGKVNGVAATLLITATRQILPDKGIPEPSIVVFEVYRLEANVEGDVGTTRDFFKRVLNWKSDKKYSNSDLALQKELGLPLP